MFNVFYTDIRIPWQSLECSWDLKYTLSCTAPYFTILPHSIHNKGMLSMITKAFASSFHHFLAFLSCISLCRLKVKRFIKILRSCFSAVVHFIKHFACQFSSSWLPFGTKRIWFCLPSTFCVSHSVSSHEILFFFSHLLITYGQIRIYIQSVMCTCVSEICLSLVKPG